MGNRFVPGFGFFSALKGADVFCDLVFARGLPHSETGINKQLCNNVIVKKRDLTQGDDSREYFKNLTQPDCTRVMAFYLKTPQPPVETNSPNFICLRPSRKCINKTNSYCIMITTLPVLSFSLTSNMWIKQMIQTISCLINSFCFHFSYVYK